MPALEKPKDTSKSSLSIPEDPTKTLTIDTFLLGAIYV